MVNHAPSPQPFTFLDLPAELRSRIYEFYFYNMNVLPLDRDKEGKRYFHLPCVNTDLLLVSRVVYNEAVTCLYYTNAFSISMDSGRLQDLASPFVCSHVRHLSLHLHGLVAKLASPFDGWKLGMWPMIDHAFLKLETLDLGWQHSWTMFHFITRLTAHNTVISTGTVVRLHISNNEERNAPGWGPSTERTKFLMSGNVKRLVLPAVRNIHLHSCLGKEDCAYIEKLDYNGFLLTRDFDTRHEGIRQYAGHGSITRSQNLYPEYHIYGYERTYDYSLTNKASSSSAYGGVQRYRTITHLSGGNARIEVSDKP